MSFPPEDRSKLATVLHDLRNGNLSAQDAAWLRQEVLDNSEARKLYLESLWLTSSLNWLLSERSEEDTKKTPPMRSPVILRPNLGLASSARVRFHRSSILATFAVAVLVYGSFSLLVWQMGHWSSPEHARQPLQHESLAGANAANYNASAVAKIQSLNGGEWELASDSVPHDGQSLRDNEQVNLVAGIAQLTFDDGVTAVIEAPARIKLTDGGAELDYGKLLVRVPPAGIGFYVDVAAARIVDLGTEFGVDATQDGELDVHVLDGRVEVREAPGSKVPRSVELVQGQGLHISAQQTMHPIVAEVQKFAGLSIATRKPVKKLADDYEVIFHYQLHDATASADQPAREILQGSGSCGEKFPLKRHGMPVYAAGARNRQNLLALRCSGDKPEGYVGRGILDVPQENWVLEAWVNARSDDAGEFVYVGHSSLNGFGLLVHQGNWTSLYGSVSIGEATSPVERNRWTHVAWLFENGRGQLFVDGQPVGEGNRFRPHPPDPVIRIGCRDETLPASFNGEIAEVRLLKLKKLFQRRMLLVDQ